MKFCRQPFYGVYVAPENEVWPCAWMHFKIGNLNDQDLYECWHSEKAQEARESILNGSFAYCRKTSCPYLERDDLMEVSEDELASLAIPTDIPEYLIIANDRTCNIACTTCRTGIYCPKDGEREKIDRALKALLPYANHAKTLELNGNGEFLANPSFLRFLNELHPKHSDCSISFQTNGILFDESHWEKFSHLSAFNLSIAFTLNSLRRSTYRYLSGGFDHLERVRENLRFLSGLRRENKINRLNVVMVVQECNFQEIPEYVNTLAHADDLALDRITLRPVYKWFGMKEETYWFKNILDPLHPYHKEYLKILEDDCWKEPKVYDWGCHNLREARPHPLTQEKIYNQMLLNIYENPQGLSAVDFVKKRVSDLELRRVGVFGENEMSKAMLRLLKEAGAEIAFQLTWFKTEDGEIPKVSMQDFRPDMADTMLLLDFYDRQNLTNNLRTLKFQGRILTAEELIGGTAG